MTVLKFRTWDVGARSFVNFEDTLPDSDNEVMQAVGIEDKEKHMVYEGDICRGTISVACVKKEMTGQVVYNQKNGRYELKDAESSIPLYMAANLKVIGNIYENSDLLEH